LRKAIGSVPLDLARERLHVVPRDRNLREQLSVLRKAIGSVQLDLASERL